jgi:pyruvate dehydrogenase E2 component (dihydrolipoamide acetyltransferase)
MSIAESKPGQSNIRVTPAARELAERAGIALSMVAGTGPDNQIEVADVEALLSKKRQTKPLSPDMLPPEIAASTNVNTAMDTAEKAKIQAALEKRRTQALQQVAPPENAAAPTPNAPKVVKLSERRQAIGSLMQRSIQTVPHSFLEIQIDTYMIEALHYESLRLSITSILIKACAWALQRNPWLNATFQADKSGEIVLWPSANIGIVIPTEDGPVVPVIQQAERLHLREIHEKVNSLSERARNNVLSADDLADATFTISDMGMFDVDRFTAIIHPPQVAILSAGRITKLYVPYSEHPEAHPVPRSILNLTLSVDQRVIDNVQAARFLADLRSVLEEEDHSRLAK